MRLKELLRDLSCERLENISDCEIKGITCNSRNIAPGYLFVAIQGAKLDGHNFVNQAVEKGAQALILQRDVLLKKRVAKIFVPDTRVALARVCAAFFRHPAKKLKAIGITGTNGKTTTAYIIEKILTTAGYGCGVIGTINYRIGEQVYPAKNTTPPADILQPFLQEIVRAKAKYAIIEVSSHALDQHRVDCIDFSAAIFTNLAAEHLDYHGSLNNYFSCKLSLFERLRRDASAIVNVDDPYGRVLLKKIKSKAITYGLKYPAHISAKEIKSTPRMNQLQVLTPGGSLKIETPLLGVHNIYNILASVAYAFIEDIAPAHIISGIKMCSFIPGRLEHIPCRAGIRVFVDYAHTEDALRKVLVTLKNLLKNRSLSAAKSRGGGIPKKRGKVILVFGCGGERDKAKRPGMGKIAAELSDFAIITSDNPRSEDPQKITSDIIRGMDKSKAKYKVVLDRFKAIEEAISMAERGDIVLIAGKGHESSQIFAHRVIPFNDREAVEKILGHQ